MNDHVPHQSADRLELALDRRRRDVLPPEVFTRSFLRSVIFTRPMSSISPMSPLANQRPSGNASAFTSGRFR